MQKSENLQRVGQVWIAADHAGFELKNQVVAAWSERLKFENKLIDLGTDSAASVDYPDFAQKLILARAGVDSVEVPVAHEKIRWSEPFGILICGSGQGMAIKANRDIRVRAALCWDNEVAELARRHNDANILVLGARSSAPELVFEMIQTFFHTAFEGGRHEKRVLKLS